MWHSKEKLKTGKTGRNCYKASILREDSVPPISGYWPTSELNAG